MLKGKENANVLAMQHFRVVYYKICRVTCISPTSGCDFLSKVTTSPKRPDFQNTESVRDIDMSRIER